MLRGRRIGTVLLRATLPLMVILLTAAVASPASAAPRPQTASGLVGPKAYYLGLGDSLAFGYQPNFDWSHGYVQQWYSYLRTRGTTSLTNYGCNGETTTTFIKGGCPNAWLLHNYHSGPQLTAAVNFIKARAGRVSPVSLDLGANDVFPDVNSSTCTVKDYNTWEAHLSTMNTNLTTIILPQLLEALKSSTGTMSGDLVMMNYYNPWFATCGDSPYIQELNQDLANDAAAAVAYEAGKGYTVRVPVADVYGQFASAGNPPSYIWMSSSYADIHPTTTGYGAIMNAFKAVTQY